MTPFGAPGSVLLVLGEVSDKVGWSAGSGLLALLCLCVAVMATWAGRVLPPLASAGCGLAALALAGPFLLDPLEPWLATALSREVGPHELAVVRWTERAPTLVPLLALCAGVGWQLLARRSGRRGQADLQGQLEQDPS